MLDFQQYGVTANSLMTGRDEKNKPIKLPFVIFVPGSSIDSVFGQYERSTPEGAKHVQVKLRMGEMFAAESNGYILISPLEEALTAVIEAKQKVTADLSADQCKRITGATAAYYLNMKVCGPILLQFIKQAEDMMALAQQIGGRAGGM